MAIPKWIDLTAGAIHTCALLTTGEVACWGSGREGQLGDGTFDQHNTPVLIGALSGIVRVTAGYEFGCAIRADRTIACAGENNQYQLGDGTMTDRPSPVTAFSPPLMVDQIAPGWVHNCARIGGEVSCWGDVLGEGSMPPSPTPVMAPGLADATEIASGVAHTCARRSTGGVACWGNNDFGVLGNGTTGRDMSSTTPVPVSLLSDAVQLAHGGTGQHACALRATGQLVCWGWNMHGQLGDGTRSDRSISVPVIGLPP